MWGPCSHGRAGNLPLLWGHVGLQPIQIIFDRFPVFGQHRVDKRWAYLKACHDS